jgi:peptide methionine sulfoxide reductase msrA/msrB
MKRYRNLKQDEQYIIEEKGTEMPFNNKYDKFFDPGVYVCKKCDEPLFISSNKFNSGCGWPSFDEELPGKVIRQKDADGRRVEILCAYCHGHLGHVFQGEHYTAKNTRHCVNSLSLIFCSAKSPQNFDRAVFAGGCFWGLEYLLKESPGVISTACGYMGGHVIDPSYEELCQGKSGHKEVVEVIFDAHIITFMSLTKIFFEIHDPTQKNGQGPDIGSQYQSAIFYLTKEQKESAQKLIEELEHKGYYIATEVRPASVFYRAEEYHQNYYEKSKEEPYCHFRVQRF